MCFPISKLVFYYLFFSFILSVPALSYLKQKEVGGWFAEFLAFFLPLLAFPYVYFSKKNKKQFGHYFLIIWAILGVYFFAIRRLCSWGLTGG